MAITLVLICLSFLGVPLWIVAAVGGVLRRETEPGRRADLATTPVFPATHLRNALRGRLSIAHLPSFLAIAGLGVGVYAIAFEGTGGGGGHADQMAAFVTGIVIMGAFAILIADCTALGSLWTSARKACPSNTELALPTATVAATLRAFGAIILAVVAGSLLARLADNSWRGDVASIVLGAVAAFAVTVVAFIRERRAWKQLANAYLDMEPKGRRG